MKRIIIGLLVALVGMAWVDSGTWRDVEVWQMKHDMVHRCPSCGHKIIDQPNAGILVIDTNPQMRCFYCPKCGKHWDEWLDGQLVTETEGISAGYVDTTTRWFEVNRPDTIGWWFCSGGKKGWTLSPFWTWDSLGTQIVAGYDTLPCFFGCIRSDAIGGYLKMPHHGEIIFMPSTWRPGGGK